MMYFKRFAQLFLIFFLAILIFLAVFETNFTGNVGITFIFATIIAYIFLTLPLVFLTLAKSKKKESIVGTQNEHGDFSRYLQEVPGYVALSTQNSKGITSTTLMSFTQSKRHENILYMVTDRNARKVQEMKTHPQVSFTSWLNNLENGARLSSNQVHVELFEEIKENKKLIEAEPHILALHENAAHMTIIQLTCDSILYENFKEGSKILDFRTSQ